MYLQRTCYAIERSRIHLNGVDDSNLDKHQISNYLACVSAVIFYSEMEECLKSIVRKRLNVDVDGKLGTFLNKTNEKMLSRMKRKELSETIGLFGDDCEEEFKRRFPPEEIAPYHNVISERHLTAHGSGSNITLNDVETAVNVGERILVAVEEIIA